MLRRVYVQLLRWHPAAFRERFGDEMLENFDDAAGAASVLALLADGLLSIVRQWVFRPEFRRPAVPGPGAALFRSMESERLRTPKLLEGALVTVVIFSAMAGAIGKRAQARGVRMFPPGTAAGDRNERVRAAGRMAEDPWRASVAAHFKGNRVLEALDADHDFTLSPWETITAPAALRRLDRDGDGRLSAEECGFVRGDRGKFMQGDLVLATLDADRDGVISVPEIDRSAAALRRLDRDGDGSLTAEELMPHGGGRNR